MERSYIKAFVDWLERYQKLSDAELGRLLRASLQYKKDGTVVELTGREGLFLDGIILDIDRDEEQYQQICEMKRTAGMKGAEARWKNSTCHSANSKNSTCHFCHNENGKDGKDKRLKIKDERLKIKDINKTICAEPEEPTPAPVINLPLVDKSLYGVSESDVAAWSEAYPKADVLAELKKMAAWLDANPTNRKTRKGIKRFIVSWLSRVQDRGGYRGSQDSPQLTPEQEARKEAYLRERR